jgi:hypothetical protein
MKYRCSIELPTTHRVPTDDIYRQLAHKLIRDMPMFELAKVFQFSELNFNSIEEQAEIKIDAEQLKNPKASEQILYRAEIETNTKTTQT